jgi:hypothetical protein
MRVKNLEYVDEMSGTTPATNIGAFILGCIGLVLVAGFNALVLWLVAKQVDALSLSWSDSMWIGLGYVAWRVMDKAAWKNAS